VAFPLLDSFSAPKVVLICAALLGGSSLLLLLLERSERKYGEISILKITSFLVLLSLLFLPVIPSTISKGRSKALLLSEVWNSFAKISVYQEAGTLEDAISEYLLENPSYSENKEYLKRLWGSSWGMSKLYSGPVAPHYFLDLDSGASTTIPGAGVSPPEHLDYLKWDVTSAAYWIADRRENFKAFIIGGGGGRDILTAHNFGAQKIKVAELNPAVVNSVETLFGAFSGKPYSLPEVEYSIGEARSVLSRDPNNYDVIQMSMIDTFAATSSGALVLSENNLYTLEAVELFLQKLSERGILSISRWYNPSNPGEFAKTLSLVVGALRARGVTHPEQQLVVFANSGYLSTSVVTLLVKSSLFTDEEISRAKELSSRMGFQLLLPSQSGAPLPEYMQAILSGGSTASSLTEFDLRPPTDDWPFFFNYHYPFYSWYIALRSGDLSRGSTSTVTILAVILLLALMLQRTVIRPLKRIASKKFTGQAIAGPLLYFGGIGFGFMAIEFGLIQRYILFLGHPSYALTVVLCSLLLLSALGSLLSERIPLSHHPRLVSLPILSTICGALFTAFVVPPLLEQAFTWNLSARIAVAVLLISPLAIVMGMVFPLGVRMLLNYDQGQLVPFVWGINGIFSVLGSVLGMFIAITHGYTTVFVCGACAYFITLIGSKYLVTRK
jgi:spermidine synthase